MAYVKVFAPSRKHRNHTWTLGVNTCTQKWNTDHCSGGGFYACELKDLFLWLDCLYPCVRECGWVDVPAGAHLVVYDDKIKASQLEVLAFVPVEDMVYQFAVRAPLGAAASAEKALMWACLMNRTELVRRLVQLTYCPLSNAMQCVYGNKEIAQVLREAGMK